MKKRFKLGVIGCGDTAVTVLRGVVLSEFLREKKIIVSDVNEENFKAIDELGVNAVCNDKFVAENSEFLLLAVNSRRFDAVIKNLKGFCPEKIISVVPELRKTRIKKAFGAGTVKVARCVLNLPCSIGSGVIGVDMSDFNKSTDDTEFISKALGTLGDVYSIYESKMDAVSAMGGLSPAYAFVFISALIDAGVKLGLTKDEAKALAVQSVLGSAEMVKRDEQSVDELLMRVCGKGSAAIEAVKVLEENNFRKIVEGAVGACAARSKELSDK